MKSLLRKSILVQILIVIVLQGCLDSPETFDVEGQHRKDIDAIDLYLSNNGISAVKDVSGIRMDIHVLGSGLTALTKNAINVDYTGRVLGETTAFETGTANQELYRYIAGWQYALTTLPAGSEATVYIPSTLAYGNSSKPGIPANSILEFDLKFKDIYVSDTEKNQFKTDTTAINAYLESKNITNFVKHPTGIRYVKTVEVINAFHPDLYTKVKTKLSFKLLSDDSKVVATIDRVPSDTFNGRVVDNIRAITTVLLQMKEGEKATVYAPSYLAFNTDPVSDAGNVLIPANSVVIIEVELVEMM